MLFQEGVRVPQSAAPPPVLAAQGVRMAAPLPRTVVVSPLLRQLLDTMAHGLVLVDAVGRVLHANPVAQAQCGPHAPVSLDEQVVSLPQGGPAQARLEQALERAASGQWAMLTARIGGRRLALAVVPLADDPACPGVRALLVMGSEGGGSALALEFFCSQHDLTPAECAVLVALSHGESPAAIARGRGVALSTVRSQVQAMRHKVRAGSTAELVRLLLAMPPIASSRGGRLRI